MAMYVLLLLLLINLKEYKSMLLRGKRAYDGQFPWLIQFQTIIPCGGVLLSSDWVLTAAQCVQDRRDSVILLASGLNGTESTQTVSVKATYIHPRYEAYSAHPDRDSNIALLKLIEPFRMCNTEIHLPNVVSVKHDNNYKSCLIFGWQSYISASSKVLAKPIRYSEVILNSWKLCAYMIKANANYTNVFCTMVEFTEDIKACAGNPGSPVVCKNQYHESTLLGIASWTNFSLACGVFPTYIDLDKFRIWMHEIMFNNNKREEENYEPHESSQHGTDTLLPNYSDTNLSSSGSHQEMLYSDIIEEPSNKLYRYEEIDKIKASEDQNQIMRTLNRHKELKIFNKSLLCNNEKVDKPTTEHNRDQIELDDFEFLLPFNFEDASISYSNITIIYCKDLYVFYFTLLCILYIIDI